MPLFFLDNRKFNGSCYIHIMMFLICNISKLNEGNISTLYLLFTLIFCFNIVKKKRVKNLKKKPKQVRKSMKTQKLNL